MACLISCSEISLFTCTVSGPTFIFKGVMFSEHIGAGVVFCWKRRLKKVCHSCTVYYCLKLVFAGQNLFHARIQRSS